MTFEKEYYENSAFWKDGMLEDSSNMERFEKTFRIIPKHVSTLVDVGCGNGVFLNSLISKNVFKRLVGVDRSSIALSFVQTEKCQSDISSLPFHDNTFDCVTCLEVLEHIPYALYPKSISELARLSSKYIVVSVPFNEDLSEAFNKCPYCSSCFNKELHLRSYSEEDVNLLFKDIGFKCVKMEKLGYSKHYFGHFRFRRMFYPEQFLKWNSPICPVCGYTEEMVEKSAIPVGLKKHLFLKNTILPILTRLPKLLWPRVSKPYWILALYEKEELC